MSILACLGNDAEAIRDIYLARLQANTEVSFMLGMLSYCDSRNSLLFKHFSSLNKLYYAYCQD